MYGLGSPEVAGQARRAHERAITQALGYLERHAAVVSRGHARERQELTNGFVAAAYLHRTSRAGDPLLHTHVLVAAMGRGADGRWTALDARALYAHAKTAGFLYQAVLRAELTRRLGVEWDRCVRAPPTSPGYRVRWSRRSASAASRSDGGLWSLGVRRPGRRSGRRWQPPAPAPDLPVDPRNRQFRKALKRNAIRVRERQGALLGVHVLDLGRTITHPHHDTPRQDRPGRASPIPHLRTGHFRRVRVGPRDRFHYEPRWIPPVWVQGDTGKATERLVVRRLPTPAAWDRPSRRTLDPPPHPTFPPSHRRHEA